MEMTTANKKNESYEGSRSGVGTTCEFSQINVPGLYLERRSGTLIRVPHDAVLPGRSPAVEILSSEPWVVTRIADDPFTPITKARMLAADQDLLVNF
jgi:hypothetical protein